MADVNEPYHSNLHIGASSLSPFAFSVELAVSHLVAVDAGGAVISGYFRHFHTSAIEVGVGEASGQLNLGFRLFREAEDSHVFEGRCLFETACLAPGAQARCTVFIPRAHVEFGRGFRLLLDLVYERYYWFREFRDCSTTVQIGFCDAALAEQLNLQQLQLPVLEDTLIKALARIAELERSERRLIAERDESRLRLAARESRIEREVEALAALAPPAADISALIRGHDPVQRRDLWLRALSASGAHGPLFALTPHDGAPGKLRLLVIGSGGLGDMLYTSTVVRELHAAFAPADVFVLYECPAIDAVFGTNPHVSGALALKGEAMQSLLRAVHSFDIFDLVAEVRYAVTYAAPPLSRVPMSFRLRANAAAAEWQKYVRYDWPHLNNLFGNAVTARGLGKLDLVGLTALLPIARDTDIDLFIPADMPGEWPTLTGAAYVTIHHGADPNMAAGGGVQTKNLPAARWQDAVALIKQAGLLVVQLGEAHEQPITGVDLDLRGATSFLQSAAVIKAARAHVDTEGGLVHVARAVNTRSVVLFGPTPPDFFGYPQNDNVAPRVCGNCWWVTRRWSIECPRGLANPECMATHDPADIAARALRIARPEQRVVIEIAASYPIAPGTADVLSNLGTLPGDGLVLVAPGRDPAEAARAAAAHLPRATLLVDTAEFRPVLETRPDCVPIRPYSAGNIPLATGGAGWAIALGLDPCTPARAALMLDLLRCVTAGSTCHILIAGTGEPTGLQVWLDTIADAILQLPGGGYRPVLPASATLQGRRAGSLLLQVSLAPAAVLHESPTEPPGRATAASTATGKSPIGKATRAKPATAKPVAPATALPTARATARATAPATAPARAPAHAPLHRKRASSHKDVVAEAVADTAGRPLANAR